MITTQLCDINKTDKRMKYRRIQRKKCTKYKQTQINILSEYHCLLSVNLLKGSCMKWNNSIQRILL